ncbi:MAG TPA: GAF and ANTAR domain-containing protein [Micromonosporaceae bacterium]|nr:GAF and ANTAR domain-containing protein [Micromonosporaceae bacterium]
MSTDDRRSRLWARLVEDARGDLVSVRHVCAVTVVASGVDGVAMVLAVGSAVRETVCATDEMAADVAGLALTVGEGPATDAFTDSRPVLAADLTEPDYLRRWPIFAPAATRAGARAVFALPLQVGAIRLGVLELYRRLPGGLGRWQLTDALVLADVACLVLLDGADGRPPPKPIFDRHPEIHQATGMIIVQLGVSAEVAFIRLRAYAYARDRRLVDVAADVVARRLRFEREPNGYRSGRQ